MKVRVSKEKVLDRLKFICDKDILDDLPDFIELEGEVVEEKCEHGVHGTGCFVCFPDRQKASFDFEAARKAWVEGDANKGGPCHEGVNYHEVCEFKGCLCDCHKRAVVEETVCSCSGYAQWKGMHQQGCSRSLPKLPEKITIYGTHYHCKKCGAELTPIKRQAWKVPKGVTAIHECPRDGELLMEYETP